MSKPVIENNLDGIAIIGMAGRFPGAPTLDQFWRNLRDGVESLTSFSDEELIANGISPAVLSKPSYVKVRGVLDDVDLFDASFFGFSPREAEVLDPQHRLFLECAWQALEVAGYISDESETLIGIYAGTSMSSYLFSLYSDYEFLQMVGGFQAMIGNDKDHLPTRVSYKLNLKGPSVAVQTACSTSLVAVHLACQGLLDYQCDIALAGGVSVTVPQKSGYFYTEGGINSPDGHCRAFDAQANGTVGGNGLGIVVLKRLADAIADRDHIRAIIRGSAINNDGAMKVGYTAPSEEGQAAVIALAQEIAGIDSDTVTYIEAHGTGTPLGDPIEIAALTRAFAAGTDKKEFCAIGSLKTNIGHLDAAAGVAGLIKVVLALENKHLFPSIHFNEPNPNIDFKNSPFYINNKLAEWPANGTPRRAGVSSFGIGGTNAHIVVEEVPAYEKSGHSRPFHLIFLSAKTETALEKATTNLAEYLKQEPEVNLADAAYTLLVGRRRFGCRRMVICSDVDDAITVLENRDPLRVLTDSKELWSTPVILMFPGQGVQHVNMGRDLYLNEGIFREQVNQCSEVLKLHLKLDLRDVIYPRSERVEKATTLLTQTHITQPALFVIEYATARLLISWGIRPKAMIGHSIGEYVAATLAGVLSLEDALMLVAARGRLIQEMPPGAMLAVELSSTETYKVLSAPLSLAAVNGPEQCVVSGPSEAIDQLQHKFQAQGTACHRLHTSHAFHSDMMSPVLKRFTWLVKKVKLNPPSIPYVSNLTGNWISPQEATDPEYWSRHLRETVRFADGLEKLLQNESVILLETGPGQTLSTLARSRTKARSGQKVLSSMRHSREDVSDEKYLLTTLGRLWLAGVDLDWAAFYQEESRYRIPLPTYPFERQRFWVSPKNWADSDTVNGNSPLPVNPEINSERVAAETNGSDAAVEGQAVARSTRSRHLRPDLATVFMAPRDEVEQAIASVWEDLLGIEPIGIYDNFLELGGHSLLATHVATRLREKFAIELPLRSLFESPTISGLAAVINKQKSRQSEQPYIEHQLPAVKSDFANRHEPFPLTDVQHAYWIGRTGVFELGNVATHVYVETEMGGLNLDRFNLALQLLINRHDMLRAIFTQDGLQRILPEVPPYEIKRLDLRGLDSEEVESNLNRVRREMSHQILRTDQWPLFELRASLLDDGQIRFHFSFDAIIGDALSMQIMATEFAQYYRDVEAELPPLTISFRDYIIAEGELRKTELYQRAQRYWEDRLDTLAFAPRLPIARNPALLDKPRFVRRNSRLDSESWQLLKARAAKSGLTPSGVLVAAYAEILNRWSKGPRFTINLTLFNRLPMHPEVNKIVGDFTSLTLLEADCSGNHTFESRARALQNQLWNDLDNRYFSGVQVLREMGRRRKGPASVTMPVVFTSTLNLASSSQQESSQESSNDQRDAVYGISQTPQVWLDHQVQERGGDLVFNWDAVEDLFPEGLLNDMFSAYCGLLRDLARDEECWQASSWQLLPPAQIEQRLTVNSTETPISKDLLHDLFASQARRQPDQPAVISSSRELSYAELYSRSNQIGRFLRQMGVGRNKLVAVVMQKGWEQIPAVLGILSSGAAYLPLSADLPKERLWHLLDHGQVDVVLTQTSLNEKLEWPDGIKRLTVEDTEILEADDSPLNAIQSPDDLAYVIYTSGSTGLPKGVMIDHRGAVNTVLDINNRFGVGPQDRTLGLSSLSFDLSVYDIFGLLAAGGVIVIPDASSTRDAKHWAQLIKEKRVTIWNSVPALMEMLVEHLSARQMRLPGSLRLVLLSGDWIPVSLPDRLKGLSEEIRVIGLGGATEASIWSILYPIESVEPSWRSIPYGKPMANQTFHVLDDRLAPCPVWVTGHLYIGGIGLAKGYWRDDEKTSQSFILNPETGERLYKTGDTGRYLPDGNIEFLGREDFQVKIGGYRIELGEIEAALTRHPAVCDCAVVALGEMRGNKRLVAYTVFKPGEMIPANEQAAFLREKLPEYLIPSLFLTLERLPLSSNGKVDRSRLPIPEQIFQDAERKFLAPTSPVEEALVNIWQEVLGLEQVSVDGDLFELGGDSLQATRIIGLIRKAFNVEVSVRQLLEAPTIAGMALAIEEAIIDELANSEEV